MSETPIIYSLTEAQARVKELERQIDELRMTINQDYARHRGIPEAFVSFPADVVESIRTLITKREVEMSAIQSMLDRIQIAYDADRNEVLINIKEGNES